MSEIEKAEQKLLELQLTVRAAKGQGKRLDKILALMENEKEFKKILNQNKGRF